ncbi:MAG: dockerin type I domain-containing protein, partial [Pirellulales bacterium]|nr:dockerin type I domain-containing protein [Pirellulales bacterium]
ATANGAHHLNDNAGLPSAFAPGYAGVNSTADNEDPSDPVGQYDFVNSDKVDGHDYDDTEGILNFTAVNNGLVNGSFSQTISVPLYGDEVVELDEWLTVTIGTSDFLDRSVTVANPEAYVWIDNDDEASVSVSDAVIQEGDVGQAYAFIDVTLDNSVDVPLGITYETTDGTATSLTTLFNGDEDYVQTSGVLNFAGAAGEVVQVQVPINGDQVVELDELFEINLTDVAASNRDVTIGDGQSDVTIVNDDSATVLIRDAAILEGDAGVSVSTATVVLSAPVDVAVSTTYLTVDGTAVSSADYTSAAGEVLFGNLKTDVRSVDVDVDVLGDEMFERHEVFTVELGVLDAGGRSVAYLDTDDTSAVEARIDIVNDDRNARGFIGVCNVVAEPGDVDLDNGVRYAAWNFSIDNAEPVDIQFTAATAAGEALEIGVPQLLDSSGTPIAPMKVDHVLPGDATRSYGVFEVAAGDYTVVVPSGNDSDGLVELAVSLPGILSDSDTEVTTHAFQRTSAGVLQTQLGYRGTMPEVFNDLMGIDLGVDQYDACLDADMNGMLTMFDLSAVDQNKGSEVPKVSLLEDRFTPAQILNVDPLGASELSISDLFGFSIYQNPENPLDVNNDGHISPIDALVTINSLNDEGSRSVLVLGDNEGDLGENLNRDQYLYDTNGDFAITPIDVLRVVNALNEAGEAESVAVGGAEGEAITDHIFENFDGVTLKAAGFDSAVTALASAAEPKEYGQEYYATPVRQTHWADEVDALLKVESGSDSEDDLEIGGVS